MPFPADFRLPLLMLTTHLDADVEIVTFDLS